MCLKDLIDQEKWSEITKKFSTTEIVNLLSFKEAVILADNLFNKNYFDHLIQEFAINLLFKIKEIDDVEWDQDWKNDIYLRWLCYIAYRYEEAFELCKRAYSRFSDPPESILIDMAQFAEGPPECPSISDDEAEELLKKAFAKKPSYEAANKLKRLYSRKKNIEQEKYWRKISEEAKEKNIHTSTMFPDVFENK